MTEASIMNVELAGELLRRLRPVDISLAIRVYRGSALAERPPLEELCRTPARIYWLAALTSFAGGQSHSGLRLTAELRLEDLFTGPELAPVMAGVRLTDLLGSVADLRARFPDRIVDAAVAKDAPEAFFVHRGEAELVYLHRWYALEAELGGMLRARLAAEPQELPEEFAPVFQAFFGPADTERNPWQAVACLSALRHDLAVITGGPGTGKTTTITRLIGLLLSLPEAQRPREIQMVAPTGKAAERMREAFAQNFERLLDQLPTEEAAVLRERGEASLRVASTIHALLGSRGLGNFAHHAGNPVSCDLLIVDEATMVDLDLFVALFRALPADCRVVLLGDKNQLTAVETGNVFSDLTTAGRESTARLNAFTPAFAAAFERLAGTALPAAEGALPICGDRVTELVHSYRFRGDSQVGRMARLLLEAGRLPERGELPLELVRLEDDWQTPVRVALADYATALRGGASPEVLLEQLEAVRILCAVRAGDAGVEAVNRLLAERVLSESPQPGFPQHGLPFMIVRNDAGLGLWNGDCGVFLREAGHGLMAFLPPESEGEPARRLDPFALPEWEPAFAMTIHKSQGSEYDAVVVILPETQRPFISWELVYTGVTRAKDRVTLVLPKALEGTPLPPVRRVSGLLWEIVRR